jgi:hypothetical protein
VPWSAHEPANLETGHGRDRRRPVAREPETWTPCYTDCVRFWLGLAVGALLGAAVTWLTMARPWRTRSVVATSPPDAGPAPTNPGKEGRKGRRPRRGSVEAAEAPTLAAADLAMTWRGAALSLPDRSIDLGTDDGGRPLEDGEINQVLERSSDPILSCIRDALAGAELRGEARLQLLVDESGAVTRVRVGAPRWLMDHGFADCATARARRIRFPATGAPTIVDAPYHIE